MLSLRRILLATALLAVAVPATARAVNVTATGTVTGSTLSVTTSATPSFSASLDSGDQTPTYTVPLTAQDTRGTGAGWNLTVTSTTFTTGGATPYTLATNASSVFSLTNTCTSGTCTSPTNAKTYPLAIPAAATAPTAVKFFNSAADTGMGKFTVTPTVTVAVPQNAYAGTYSSTMTVSVVSAAKDAVRPLIRRPSRPGAHGSSPPPTLPTASPTWSSDRNASCWRPPAIASRAPSRSPATATAAGSRTS